MSEAAGSLLKTGRREPAVPTAPLVSGAAPATRTPQASRPKPRRLGKLVPWIIGAAVLALLIAGLRPKPLPVEMARVQRGPLAVSVYEEGKTRIRRRYTISPPISGYLERIIARPGDRVEAGKTVLARVQPQPASLLNPREETAAEARVRGAEAALQQREAELERDRAYASFAKRDEDRQRPLYSKGAISGQDWDTAQRNSAIGTRQVQSGEAALQMARFDLQQAQAALLQAEGMAAPDGKPFEITSPVTGFVLNVFEESARLVSAGAPVLEVGDPADLEAEIELLSTDAASVVPGAEAVIERWGGDKPLHAIVRVVEPAAFTKTSALGVEEQRVKVRVDFTEPLQERAQLGDRYRVEARIYTWKADRVLQVPTGALFRRGSDWLCFVGDSGRAVIRKVGVGHNDGLAAEVVSGLREGEKVIVHPPEAVTEGSRVRE